jgi:hypothetical protein
MAEQNEGLRRHKLLPENIKNKLPKLYSQEENKNPMVYLKLFSPYSQHTWYITEYDGEDTFFGYTVGDSKEWGYISFNELASANNNGLPLVERDKYFKPKKFKSIEI